MDMEDDEEEEDDEDREFAEVLMRGLNSYTGGKGLSKSPLEKPVKKINRLLALDQSDDSD